MKRREQILLGAGLFGLFTYFGLTELAGAPFHSEWIIGFLAMCGVVVAVSKDRNGK